MGKLLAIANRMKYIEKRLGETEGAAAVASAILKELVYSTPVDTSLAASNWQIGIGSPADSLIPPYVVGSKGSSAAASRAAAYNEGIAKLATRKPGETVYISNTTPYIKQLDQGTSTQAPQGMTERALLIGRTLLGKVRVL